MAQFVNGVTPAGLVGKKTFLFCDSTGFIRREWIDQAQDDKGNLMWQDPINEQGPIWLMDEYPTKYAKFVAGENLYPYWSPEYKFYSWIRRQPNEMDNVCSRSVLGNTAPGKKDGSITFIILCPQSFKPPPDAPDSPTTLVRPTTGCTVCQPLDQVLPVMVTFYHELFHLVVPLNIDFSCRFKFPKP